MGFALAAYLYFEGKEAHQLTYYISPAKAVVVQTGQASKLAVSFDGKPVGTDITAAQIAIWNQGKLPIKKDDVLRPIVIDTENNAPILEATIRKSSRDVTHLALNIDELQKGRVSISWNILEQNDGGIIQLVYAGNPALKIYVDGIIEGQRSIVQSKQAIRDWFSILILVFLTISLLGELFLWYVKERINPIILLTALLDVLVIAWILYDMLHNYQSSPPFSF